MGNRVGELRPKSPTPSTGTGGEVPVPVSTRRLDVPLGRETPGGREGGHDSPPSRTLGSLGREEGGRGGTGGPPRVNILRRRLGIYRESMGSGRPDSMKRVPVLLAKDRAPVGGQVGVGGAGGWCGTFLVTLVPMWTHRDFAPKSVNVCTGTLSGRPERFRGRTGSDGGVGFDVEALRGRTRGERTSQWSRVGPGW